MKKLIIIALLFAACKSTSHDGTYVNHTEGQYSVADDTIIVADTVIINRTGYQKIRNGQRMRNAFKIRKWTMNSPDVPTMLIADDRIVIGSTIYTKLS